jgi:hypothetical protein
MSYPVKRADYGSYSWLAREIGVYLQFGGDDATWTHEQREKIDSIIQSGVSNFHHPQPLPVAEGEREKPPHSWSFLQPIAELELVDGQKAYELPESFSGVVGDFTVKV